MEFLAIRAAAPWDPDRTDRLFNAWDQLIDATGKLDLPASVRNRLVQNQEKKRAKWRRLLNFDQRRILTLRLTEVLQRLQCHQETGNEARFNNALKQALQMGQNLMQDVKRCVSGLCEQLSQQDRNYLSLANWLAQGRFPMMPPDNWPDIVERYYIILPPTIVDPSRFRFGGEQTEPDPDPTEVFCAVFGHTGTASREWHDELVARSRVCSLETTNSQSLRIPRQLDAGELERLENEYESQFLRQLSRDIPVGDVIHLDEAGLQYRLNNGPPKSLDAKCAAVLAVLLEQGPDNYLSGDEICGQAAGRLRGCNISRLISEKMPFELRALINAKTKRGFRINATRGV